MTLAIILVVYCRIDPGLHSSGLRRSEAFSSLLRRRLQINFSRSILQAFRNLVDPAESEYFRRRLSCRGIPQRSAPTIGCNAGLHRRRPAECRHPDRMAESARFAGDSQTVAAAHQLVENAQLLRINAAVASCWIYAAYVWPSLKLGTAPIVHGYEQVSGSAMLLGRLQNPTSPVRLSATSYSATYAQPSRIR